MKRPLEGWLETHAANWKFGQRPSVCRWAVEGEEHRWRLTLAGPGAWLHFRCTHCDCVEETP